VIDEVRALIDGHDPDAGRKLGLQAVEPLVQRLDDELESRFSFWLASLIAFSARLRSLMSLTKWQT
jgi:hypothetical protein